MSGSIGRPWLESGLALVLAVLMVTGAVSPVAGAAVATDHSVHDSSRTLRVDTDRAVAADLTENGTDETRSSDNETTPETGTGERNETPDSDADDGDGSDTGASDDETNTSDDGTTPDTEPSADDGVSTANETTDNETTELNETPPNNETPADDGTPNGTVTETARSGNETEEVIVRVEDFEIPGASAMSTEGVVEELKARAESSQQPIIDYAESTDGVTIRNTYWLTNAVLLEIDTTEVDVRELVDQEAVTGVHENFEVEAPNPTESTGVSTADAGTTYGLEQINATEVWEKHGTRGAGAEVAVLDTGIDASHPDLELSTDDPTDETYPGGWAEFDSNGDRIEGSTPYASTDHGTHVSGTVAGGDASGTAIGVAPDAELKHGLVLPDGTGSFAQIIGGMEWAVEEDVDVISMSLGGDGYRSTLIEPIRNAEDTGTVVVAAIGNHGPERSHTPANVYDAYAVGASGPNRDIANFSSGERVRTDRDWGDAQLDHWPNEYVVPDVSAPGVDTYSTLPGGEYGEKSGTSMATPHVSGVAALMVSASGGDLSPDEIKDALDDSATKPAGAPERKDTRYGHGIIDAMAATTAVAAEQGVDGTVTNADGEPLTGASVRLDNGAETTTNETGAYLVRALPGTYEVTVSEFGYESSTVEVDVGEETMTSHDVALEPTLATDVTDPQDEKVKAGDVASVTYRAAHADTLTVERSGSHGNVTLVVNGEKRAFGTPIPIDPSDDETVRVRVETEADSGGSIALEHTVSGMNETTTFTTGPTTVVPDSTSVGIVDSTGSKYAKSVRTAIDETLPTEYFVSVVSPAEATANIDSYDVFVVHKVDPDDDLESFVDATADPETGVVYLDQWGNTSNGVTALSQATQNPVVTGETTQTDRPEYEVVTGHPIFDGVAAEGESVRIHDHSRGDIAWFDRYQGTTLATASDDGTELGTGIAIDESTQTALLSSLGRGSTVRNSGITGDADAILGNAITYTNSLPPAWFESRQPDHVTPGASFETTLVADDLEDVTVRLTDSTTADPENLTLSIDGTEREFGQRYEVDGSAERIPIEVDTSDGTVGAVGLTIDVAGSNGTVELLSGRTAVYEKPLVVTEEVDTIQEAIDLAPPETTVEIPEGTYTNPVTITTPGVTLTSHGDERPTVEADITSFYDPVVHVDAPNVTVEDIDVVANGQAPDGIEVDRPNATIRHVSVSGASHGVLVGGSASHASGTVVHDVEISDGVDLLALGVTVGEADDVRVYNASISGQDSGIDVYTSTDTVIENNSITDSEAGITTFDTDQVEFVDNEITDTRVGIQLEGFAAPETVSGNEISNVSEGIYVEGINAGGPIVENEIDAHYGIWIERADAPALDIRRNDLSETNVSIGNDLDGSLRAPLNYYGDRVGNESFTAGEVVYEPFLTAPPAEVDAEEPRRIGVDLSLEAGSAYGVSFPGTTEQTVSDVLDAEFDGVVYGFDADEQAWTQLTGDDSVAALQGLVVVAESDGRMTISHYAGSDGPATPGQRSLSEGWNFVGAPEYADADGAFDLETVDPGLAMAPFDAPGGQPGPEGGFDGVYRFNESEPAPAVSAYEGYFVFAEGDGTLPSYVVPNPSITELYEGIGVYRADSIERDAAEDDRDGPIVRNETEPTAVDTVLSRTAEMDRETTRSVLAQYVYRQLDGGPDEIDGSPGGLDETAAAIVDDAPAENRSLVEGAVEDALRRARGNASADVGNHPTTSTEPTQDSAPRANDVTG
ncbi:S8 family serine peptidase [Halopiger djelfimassiliensis]|uniref:S8 family serine peptidase n=1 Tax=Halopiger djelfimassiliensis TaxID=1293047 RepID=UPI000677F98E|nr:S8 family serine peptidase [Halopiger djelfimassiliensis]